MLKELDVILQSHIVLLVVIELKSPLHSNKEFCFLAKNMCGTLLLDKL